MTRTENLRALLQTRPVLCDGAMGTQLQSLGLGPGECSLGWNIERAHDVQSVHRAYLDAGADLLTTNTFSGASLALAAHGLEQRGAELNRAGARLAREVAGDRAFVLGDIGPCGGLLEPYGDVAPTVAATAFGEQARALLDGGADAILVETMSDAVEAGLAIEAARAAGAAYVLATFTFQRSPTGLRTMMGHDAATVARAAVEAGADAVGANCGAELSFEDYAGLATEFAAAAPALAVILQPNAGRPVLAAGRIAYHMTPGAFADGARRLRAAGARVLGGCCGTTPAHIAALRAVL